MKPGYGEDDPAGERWSAIAAAVLKVKVFPPSLGSVALW